MTTDGITPSQKWGVHRSEGEPATVALLDGQGVSQLSKYLGLYSFISAALSLGQRHFILQWLVANTEIRYWPKGGEK